MRAGARLLAASLAALLSSACGDGGAGARRPDVVLVVIDTLRADHCSAYGYGRPTTPRMEELAARGVLFETAYAPMGTTAPSHATLFTGRWPLEHGLARNGLALAEEERTLAELLRDAGWTTAAFVSSFPVSRRFGLDQGFEHFDDDFSGGDASLEREEWIGVPVEDGFDRPPAATTDAALGWLADEAPDDAPLFLWVHHFDPHEPYRPPRAWGERFLRRDGPPRRQAIDLYDAEVAYVDDEVGRLLDALEELRPGRERLVVLTADHGEGLWDHGWAAHNRTTYEEELRVPLVIAWDGRLPAGARVAQPAQLLDVLPTLAAALGLDAGAVRGLDLLPFARGERAPEPERALRLLRPYHERGRAAFDERGPAFGLREGRWKLFDAPADGRRELYDLERDPGEARDLAADQPQRAAGMARRLHAWIDALERRPIVSSADEEVLAGLEALGYTEAADAARGAGGDEGADADGDGR